MASNKSSIRYAKALLELAIEKNCVESIEKDLSQFLRTLKDSNDLRIFIDSPVVRNEKKIKVFDLVFPDFNPMTIQFFRLVTKNGREHLLDDIAKQFDQLLKDGETFDIGSLQGRVMYVPGHTPACVAYSIGDAVFVGDTMFMPDVGTARCDFPGGDARTLYGSVKKLLSLPPQTRLFMCHDYPPNDRPIQFETTVAAQRQSNIHVHDGISEDQFVEMRTKRDATLEMPVLILPSVQVNIRAGVMPPKDENGISYLRIPVNAL